jgi:putative DNA primase/helicase
MTAFDRIPAELRERPQWVVWRCEQRGGKATKVPYCAADPSRRASTTDSATWAPLERALVAHQHADGIGYVFAADDPFAGVDLDDCVGDDGELHSEAAAVALHLDSYAELSPSRRGVHVIARAHVNGRRNRTAKTAWGGMFEVYDRGRFFCVTGNRLTGAVASIAPRQAELDELLERMFPSPPATNGTAPAAPPLELDDRGLLERALAAKNGADLDRLYRGEIGSYPSRSEADLALCGLLAFWTGPDPARIDHLFRGSGLIRAKWDVARGDSTYGAQTIARALEGRTEFYEPRAPRETPPMAVRGADADALGESPAGERPRPTDVGNAARFAAQHCDKARFVPGIGWHIWDGRRWRLDRAGGVERLARHTARSILTEAAAAESDDERTRLAGWAIKSESAERQRAMTSLAHSERALVALPDSLDADPWLFSAENGVVDLRSGELRPANRDDLISLGSDIAYERDAACPRWQQFLDEVFAGDRELISFVQRFVGYCLTGDTREHALALLAGGGCNGKSTFLGMLKRLLGGYAATAAFDTFMRARNDRAPRNDLARLHRARLVTAAESGEGRRLDEATVKEITGGDTIAARFLYGEHFEYIPQFKLLLVTNHRPKVDGDDDAIWRRLRLIPFDQSFEGREDRELGEKLKAELPGILVWAVQGSLAWQRDGLGHAEAVTQATSGYRRDEDVLGAFLEERCVMAGEVTTSALREAYESYCNETGERPLTASVLGRRLAKRSIRRDQRSDGGRERIYRGVTLR